MPAKKMIILASLDVLFLGGVAWLFVTVPIFVIDLLPDLLPLSVFAFLLFWIGLLLLTIAAIFFIRSISPFYTWAIILLSASLIVLYNLSPLAPALGRLSFIHRMADAGSVTNPQWAHSYSWGAW